jgi:hypothetical protein
LCDEDWVLVSNQKRERGVKKGSVQIM